MKSWPLGARRRPRPYQFSLAIGRPVIVTPAMIEEWRRQGTDPYQAATQAIRDALMALAPETNACAITSKEQG